MKNYFKKKLEIWKLCFAAARDIDFKGYTNPCNKFNENTLPPPVGVPSQNHCCECNKKLKSIPKIF